MIALIQRVSAASVQVEGETIGADDFDIEVAGIRYPATASLRPLYDPTNERIKGRTTS